MIWNTLAQSQLTENLGWTLVHSLWEIAAVFMLLRGLLAVMRRASANVRYVVSAAALIIAIVLPAATYLQISGQRSVDVLRAQRLEDRVAFEDQALHERDALAAANVRQDRTSTNAGVFEPLSGIGNLAAENFPLVFPFAVGLWFLGVALFSFRLAGGMWKLHEYRARETGPVGDEWHERFARLCGEFRIGRTVQLIGSNFVQTPIAVGVFRPLIILPASVFLQMDPRQLESIIAHELVHIRRYDPLVNMLQSIAEILFFYHPGVWWISSQMRREREFAADAAVVETLAHGSVVYATALANLEELRLTAKQTLPSMATAANGGNLMTRIQRILHKKTEINDANSAWSAGLACVIISALLLAIFSFTPASFVNARAASGERKLAIGFVSIPPVDRSENPPKDSDATARLIIAKLQQHKVPAIGFVNGATISDGEKLFPVRANIVRLWRDAGLEVGIGNFKHIWFYNTPYDEYVASVEKNAAITKKLLAEKNISLKFYSYPYLNTGRNAEDRDKFEAWLSSRNLTSVKYTIDNQEWMYSYAYDMARNDNDINTMNEIRVEFVTYMDKMFDHYEAYSQDMFGRDIPQTMVLTPSRLVADSADDLFGMIQKRGYRFVPMDEALADPAYRTPENMFGNFGNSWFERWTQSAGKKLRDEPAVDPEVEQSWKNRNVKK